MMKKLNKIFLLFSLFGFILIMWSYADIHEDILDLNKSIENIYGMKDYFTNIVDENTIFNLKMYKKYSIPVYGVPYKSEMTSLGTSMPRFIGKNATGEKVPNPDFPPDSLTHKRLNDFNWIEKPWESLAVTSNFRFENIVNSPFDNPKHHEILLDTVLKSLNAQFNNLSYKNEYYNKFDYALALKNKEAWLNRFHVVVPPTRTTKGSALMFHMVGNQLYYVDLVLQPISESGVLHVNYQDEHGDVLEGYSEEIELKHKETITVNHKDIAGYTYKGLGYSHEQANPAMNSLKPGQDIYYEYDAGKLEVYLTFYFEKKPLLNEPDKVTGEIRLLSEAFDLGKGIPTGESIDIEAELTDPIILKYDMQKKSGTETYNVTVDYKYYYRKPSKIDPNVKVKSSAQNISKTFKISRDYSYYTLDSYYYAALEYLRVNNTKVRYRFEPLKMYLSNGGVSKSKLTTSIEKEHILPPTPKSGTWTYNAETKTFKITKPSHTYPSNPKDKKLEKSMENYAEVSIPDVRVRNDLLKYGDKVLSDNTWVEKSTSEPSGPPIFGPLVLKIKDFDLEHWLSNGFSKTTGTLQYVTEGKLNYTGEELNTVEIPGNPITVHTPVVNTTQFIGADKKYDQRPSSTPETLMPVDMPIKVSLSTRGMHRDIKGYRDRDYSKYVKYKRIRFPIDVFWAISEDEVRWERSSSHFLPKDTWLEVPLTLNDIYVKAAAWSETGMQTAYTQVVAKNHQTPPSAEFFANLDLKNDVAVYPERIVVTGRLFDFQVNSLSDKRWQPMFKQILGADKSQLFFATGSFNKHGELSHRAKKLGGSWPHTLPIKPSKNISKGYEDAALRLGSSAYFSLKSMGNYYHKSDGIILTPTFYHVDENYQNRQPVDLYYLNQAHKYVKIGDDIANLKLMSNASTAPNITSKIKTKTANTIYELLDLGLYNDRSPEHMFAGEGFGFDSFAGYLDSVALGATKRVFIGANRGFFSNSSPVFEHAGTQMWLGKYRLPNSTIAVPKDTDFVRDYKFGRDSRFSEGYIVINFDVEMIKQLNYKQADIKYVTDHSNEWELEGFDATNDKYGDVLYYHVNKKNTDILNVE